MKKWIFSLVLTGICASAHAQRAVTNEELTAHQWCSPSKDKKNINRVIFKKSGDIILETLSAVDGTSIEKKEGTWKLGEKNIVMVTQGIVTIPVAVAMSVDRKRVATSLGAVADICKDVYPKFVLNESN